LEDAVDVVGRINALIWAWIQSLRSAKKISIFLPFFLFALVQGLILTALILFYLPPFSNLLVPLMLRYSGETALHYPHSFAYLPFYFFGANQLLNLLLTWLIVGTATLMFAAAHSGLEPKFMSSFSQALRKIVTLFTVSGLEWGLLLLLQRYVFTLIGSEVLLRGWQVYLPLSFVRFVVMIAIVTPFAYTAPYVVLGQRGILSALRDSFSLATSNYGVTYLLIAVPALFTWAIDLVAGRAPLIVSKFSPELIVLILGLGIVTTLLVNFVIVGAITASYQLATRESR
jgi:hypothetical protein